MNRRIFYFFFALCLADAGAGMAQITLAAGPRPDDLTSAVLGFIGKAQHRLWVCMYRLSAPLVLKNVCEASSRGVQVNVLLDQSCLQEPVYKKACATLKRAGVQVWWGRGSGLMHHKYAIADDLLLVGSANWTRAGLERNGEIVANIDDSAVVRAFVTHFDCSIKQASGLQVPAVRSVCPSVFFMPSDARRLQKELLAAIDGARTSIQGAWYCCSFKSHLQALARAARRGVQVELLLEQSQNSLSGQIRSLMRAGGQVRMWRAEHPLHAKLLIVDGAVWLGSMNMTHAGLNKNAENFIVCAQSEVASKARQFFDRWYKAGVAVF